MTTGLTCIALLLLSLGVIEVRRGHRLGRAGLHMLLCGAVAGTVGALLLLVAALAALH